MELKQIFEPVLKKESTGNIEVDSARLKRLFEHGESVIYSFCSGCGVYSEIFSDRLNQICLENNIDHPGNLSNFYLDVKSCLVCDDEQSGFEIKSIEN